MGSKLTLDVLKGTHYAVNVERNGGDYSVEVTKPADSNDPYVEYEVIGQQYLSNEGTKRQLENLVRRIIETDTPSLVGTYVGETNGN